MAGWLRKQLVGRYLSDEGLRHLDNYGFHGQDHSWLAAHGLTAYWNWLVELVPLWVAPNVLTLLGFLAQVCGFLAMSYYNDDFAQPVPAWVYFFAAFALFVYQSLDNIDGKQARRTGSSSPLGELFDHVADAMGVGMIVTTIGGSFQAGPMRTLVAFFVTITPFFFYHWEEYFTGELIMGAYDGPTESQVMTMAFHIVSGCFALAGIPFWQMQSFGYQHIDIVVGLYCVTCVASGLKLQLRMWSYVRAHGIHAHRVVGVAIPFITFVALSVLYVFYNPMLLYKHAWDECRLLFLLLTILFGYITSRLIVQRVLKEPAPVAYPILAPLALAVAHSMLVHHVPTLGLPVYDPHRILKVLTVIALVQCAIFFVAVNDELTTYLGIRTFVIPYPPKTASKAPTKAASPKAASPKAASPKAASPKPSASPRGRSRSRGAAAKTQSASPRRKTPSRAAKKTQ